MRIRERSSNVETVVGNRGGKNGGGKIANGIKRWRDGRDAI